MKFKKFLFILCTCLSMSTMTFAQDDCDNVDSDGDGYLDINDVCYCIADDGAGSADCGGILGSSDDDLDGVPLEQDACPDSQVNVTNPIKNRFGDADVSDYTSDGCNCSDILQYHPNGTKLIEKGKGCTQGFLNVFNSRSGWASTAPLATYSPPPACDPSIRDRDADTILDINDNCICVINPLQEDHDANGVGAACDEDSDLDGIEDSVDNCLDEPNSSQVDSDSDTVGDVCDDCLNDSNKVNPGQCGCGNLDTDDDLDGSANCVDECPADPNKVFVEQCGCGVSEGDQDADATPDCVDECAVDPNKQTPGICGCGNSEVDSDGDGTPNCVDECDSDPNKVVVGVCGCGTLDTDADSDGFAICDDNCDNDPAKQQPGVCGCGVADTDTDLDGYYDCGFDDCVTDPNKFEVGVCGCGVADTDSDGDGYYVCQEFCIDDPLKQQPGVCGCGVVDDVDGDGAADCGFDDCPSDPLKSAYGVCGCGVADTDTDGDTVPDCNDQCNGSPDTDTDGDGVLDCFDGCLNDPGKLSPGICGCNSPDNDTDADGVLDCNDQCNGSPDTDVDSDGVLDCLDNCPDDANTDQLDDDSDGIGDVCDVPDCDMVTDSDGDGFPNCIDNCPSVFDHKQIDSDDDGIGNRCDPDPFGDGTFIDMDNYPLPGGDGVDDRNDNCLYVSNPDQSDDDKDSWGNECDICENSVYHSKLAPDSSFDSVWYAVDYLTAWTNIAAQWAANSVDFNPAPAGYTHLYVFPTIPWYTYSTEILRNGCTGVQLNQKFPLESYPYNSHYGQGLSWTGAAYVQMWNSCEFNSNMLYRNHDANTTNDQTMADVCPSGALDVCSGTWHIANNTPFGKCARTYRTYMHPEPGWSGPSPTLAEEPRFQWYVDTNRHPGGTAFPIRQSPYHSIHIPLIGTEPHYFENTKFIGQGWDCDGYARFPGNRIGKTAHPTGLGHGPHCFHHNGY